MKMPAAKMAGAVEKTKTIKPYLRNLKENVLNNYMSWYVDISKQKIAIISLGKMPNGKMKMPSAKMAGAME